MSPTPTTTNQPGGFPPPRPEPPYRDLPTRIVLEQRGGRWFGRLGWLLFLLAVVAMIVMYNNYQSYFQPEAVVQEKWVSHSKSAADKVAIITIDGVIMHNDGFAKWQIDQVRNDPNVKAVVLRIDSPGGTVTGSNYLYHLLTDLKKDRELKADLELKQDPELKNHPERRKYQPLKIVVSMGGICASGGYYISMAVGDTPDSIFAEPTTWTGSIGVLIPHYDLTGLLAKFDVTDDSIASNPLKLTGSPTKKEPPEIAEKQRKILQTLVDDSFKDFKEIVKAGRPKFVKDEEALDKAATGQVYTAKQALDLGLVDQFGYQDDAVKQAIKLNNLDENNVRVVTYLKPAFRLTDVLSPLGEDGKSAGRLDLASLLDLTAPRAYYLCTWLPALAGR